MRLGQFRRHGPLKDIELVQRDRLKASAATLKFFESTSTGVRVIHVAGRDVVNSENASASKTSKFRTVTIASFPSRANRREVSFLRPPNRKYRRPDPPGTRSA
jgi:hypothetical protein